MAAPLKPNADSVTIPNLLNESLSNPVNAPCTRDPDAIGVTLSDSRIKKMMKQEGVKAVTGEASFVVARATELFLEDMAARAGKSMIAENRRLLAYKDVAGSVQNWSALEFLRDIVPQKVKASILMEQALQAMQADAKEDVMLNPSGVLN